MENTARFALAIVLMIAVIVITNLIFPPVRRPPPTVVGDSVQVDTAVPGTAAVRADTFRASPAAPAPAALTVPSDSPAVAAAPAADTVVVESPLYRYTFSTLGAGLVGAELKRFESFTQEGGVQLVPDGAGPLLRYDLRIDGEILDLSRVAFRADPSGALALASGEGPRTLRFVGTEPTTGAQIELEYAFRPDEYSAQIRGTIRGVGERSRWLLLRVGPTLASHEADPREDERALAYVVNSPRSGIASVRLDKVDEERTEEGPLTWVAVKTKYFLVAAVADTAAGDATFAGLIAQPAGAPNAALLTAPLQIGRQEQFAFRLFIGPQEHERLQAMGSQLEDVNPYGWRVFRPIIRPLGHVITWMLVRMHDVLGFSYGTVLILFGILVRIVLWPLNSKAMRAQMRNMEIQPKLKEIQTRYKNEPEKLQKEMLRLYKEEGFNPFGGCLPMLLPFPVLITLFFVFQSTILFRGESFMWLPDLSRYDPLYILPILLGASMFVMQWLSMRTTPDPNPQLKMMLWIMPGMMTVIFLRLASGLNLYYAASTMASIPQQLQIMRERKKTQVRMAEKAATGVEPVPDETGKAARIRRRGK